MQKEFTKFTALIGQEQQKENTLIQNIKDSKEQISNLEDEYNQALSKDDDKKADGLQQAEKKAEQERLDANNPFYKKLKKYKKMVCISRGLAMMLFSYFPDTMRFNNVLKGVGHE